MGPTPITTTFLAAALLAVLLIEVAAAALGNWLQLSRLWMIGAARIIQAVVVLAMVQRKFGRLRVVGLDSRRWWIGLRAGLIWSAGFGALVALAFAAIAIGGFHPLTLFHGQLPEPPFQRVLFFCVGGILAPVAEELVFRGLIFGYLRRWGLPAAVLISAGLFAAFHIGPTLPITQIVGGVIFAAAYRTSRSLVAPITIHMLGNLAIFSLALVPA